MYKESATYTCKVQLSKPSRIGYWNFFFFLNGAHWLLELLL